MKKIIILILTSLLFKILPAQTLLQDADSVFKTKDYLNSIKIYNKALKNAKSEDEKYIYFQLGECNRLQNNYLSAKDWYLKAAKAGCTFPIINLRLGEMILMTGDYASAKTYIDQYCKDVPSDKLGRIRQESCSLGLKSKNEKPRYEIKDQTELNSTESDYSINYFKNNSVIISSSRLSGSSGYDPATSEGYSHLYEATFDLSKGEYSKPVQLKGSININGNFNEGVFSFDSVNKYGYYSSCNGKKGKDKQCNIMYAHYNETTDTWENSKLFDFNSQDFRTQQQAVTSDGNTMYFASDMPGGIGGSDLYVIKKVGGVWGKPENLGSTINTIGNECFPFISGDTLLIFASDELPGFGGLDIFESSIKNGKLSKPVNMMPPINSSADDFGLVFKNSKNEGFFCSNRIGGLGDDDIYSYYLIPVILTASGTIKDNVSLKGIEGVEVYFIGNDRSIDSVTTDNKGRFEYSKIKPNVKYNIKTSAKEYLNDSKSLGTGNELYSKAYNKSTGYDLDFALIKITKEEVKIANIYYDYDKADLREESKTELDKLINVLKETPDVNVQISAHTDERGAEDYNIELSQKRAQSVVDYLIAGGIYPGRLIAKGYGFSMPLIKHAKTEDQHQMNRRTTFKILNSSEISTAISYNYTPLNNQIQSKNTATIVPVATVTTTTQETTSQKENNNVQNNTSTTTTVPITIVNNIPDGSKSQTNTSTNITPDNSTTTPSISSGHKFFIIAGSFSTEMEAGESVKDLKSKGFSGAEIVGKNNYGLWRICFNSYSTKEEAMKDLPGIRKQTSCPSAWIFERK